MGIWITGDLKVGDDCRWFSVIATRDSELRLSRGPKRRGFEPTGRDGNWDNTSCLSVRHGLNWFFPLFGLGMRPAADLTVESSSI